jgi:ferredoxin
LKQHGYEVLTLKKKEVVYIMKVVVDKDTCVRCSACVVVCPDLFTLDDDNKAEVIFEEVPAKLEECAKAAELGCPADAITVK